MKPSSPHYLAIFYQNRLNRPHLLVSLVSLCLLPSVAFAKSTTSTDATCSINYVDQTPPNFINQKLSEDTMPLCFDGFAVMYSGKSRTALWSAELLTKSRIQQASTLERVNNFHPEARLPNSIQAELADYSHAPYDRGHLAPNGDMATTTQQYDSFSLANIVPQNPIHNRNLWKNLETNTRYLAIKYGQIYVITGVVFKGNAIKQLNKRILIPSHLYKAIYIPSLQQAGVYYSPNDDSQRVEVISLSELSKRTGIDSFPTVPAAAKLTALPLATTPTANTSPKNPKSPSTKTDKADINLIVKLITAIIMWISSLFK